MVLRAEWETGPAEVGAKAAADVMTANLTRGGLYFTMICQREGVPPEGGHPGWPACGQRFKVLRHTGGSPICPKCFAIQNVTFENGLAQFLAGIPVD